MTTNTTHDEGQRLQASAEYLENRHDLCRMLDEHVAAQQRTATTTA